MLPSTLLKICLLLSTASALYSSKSAVISLTPLTFDQKVGNSDEVWIVEFYAPWCGHCQAFASEYEKAAKALKGVVKTGAVNADDHKELSGLFNVKGFPTIKIFGANKLSPEDYQGPRTAKGLVDAALAAAKAKVNALLNEKPKAKKDSAVVELTDANFKKIVLESDKLWLVEFFAPWCGHCKKLAPLFASAAGDLKDSVKLGALDATVHTTTAKKYDIESYPTMKYFVPERDGTKTILEYEGERTSTGIIMDAYKILAETILMPEVEQVVDENSFELFCARKSLCVISVLPHILDCQASCRNNYLDQLKELSKKYRVKNMWGWVWSEAGTQAAMEEALDMGGFGYPAMAVINAKKMKYSLFRGSFSKEGIDEYLRDISYGRGTTAPVRGAVLPKIVSTPGWNGRDGVPPQEEDIDLDEKDEL